jgi:hypothetical protein
MSFAGGSEESHRKFRIDGVPFEIGNQILWNKRDKGYRYTIPFYDAVQFGGYVPNCIPFKWYSELIWVDMWSTCQYKQRGLLILLSSATSESLHQEVGSNAVCREPQRRSRLLDSLGGRGHWYSRRGSQKIELGTKFEGGWNCPKCSSWIIQDRNIFKKILFMF